MTNLASFLRTLWHPEGGHNLGGGSFEGWYFKVVSRDLRHKWALIPGIFRGLAGDDEAFVQVLDGTTGRSWYHRFPAADFSAAPAGLDIAVGPNHFTRAGFSVEFPEFAGRVRFTSELDPWPITPTSPGVMGWYAWVPSMECYHGVCSFGHALAGSVHVLDGEVADFDGGRGYLEKDWGQAFPAGYLWLHANTFAHTDASLLASVALIPWRGREFRGFIVGLRESGRLHRFATYTGARSEHLTLTDDHLTWTLRSRMGIPGRPRPTLALRAERASGGLLHAPIRTEMHKRVEETMNSRVEVTLSVGSEVVFADSADATCLEVHGETDRLLATSERR